MYIYRVYFSTIHQDKNVSKEMNLNGLEYDELELSSELETLFLNNIWKFSIFFFKFYCYIPLYKHKFNNNIKYYL